MLIKSKEVRRYLSAQAASETADIPLDWQSCKDTKTTISISARTNEQNSRMQHMVFLRHVRIQMQEPRPYKAASCPEAQYQRYMVFLRQVRVQMQKT